MIDIFNLFPLIFQSDIAKNILNAKVKERRNYYSFMNKNKLFKKSNIKAIYKI